MPGPLPSTVDLFRVTEGKDPVHERMPRPIAAEADWARQVEIVDFSLALIGN
jgi:hypothetical protein